MDVHAELINKIALEILAATERMAAGECVEEDLPSSADLARQFNLRLENVKKRLRTLKAANLIQPLGMSPKRYRFNHYALRHLEPSSELYEILCDEDSPFFLSVD